MVLRLTLILPALAMVCIAGAQASKPDNATDRAFWFDASQAGRAEVEQARLAMTNSSNEAIKTAAQKLIDDHVKMNQDLRELTSKHELMMPMIIAPKYVIAYRKLSALKGPAFDRAFLRMMIQDHKGAIKLFQKEIKKGNDLDLKEFCQKYLPEIQEHLDSLKRMQWSARTTGY